MNTYPFDEQKERNVLQTFEGQLGHPKPGVTRAMLEDYYERKGIYQQAKQSRYLNTPYSIAQWINDLVSIGYDTPVYKPFGVIELHKNDTTTLYEFNPKKYKMTCLYIKMLFTKPSYWELLENK